MRSYPRHGFCGTTADQALQTKAGEKHRAGEQRSPNLQDVYIWNVLLLNDAFKATASVESNT